MKHTHSYFQLSFSSYALLPAFIKFKYFWNPPYRTSFACRKRYKSSDAGLEVSKQVNTALCFAQCKAKCCCRRYSSYAACVLELLAFAAHILERVRHTASSTPMSNTSVPLLHKHSNLRNTHNTWCPDYPQTLPKSPSVFVNPTRISWLRAVMMVTYTENPCLLWESYHKH